MLFRSGFEAVTHMFVVAPPKTPAAQVEKLAAGFRTALGDADVRKVFTDSGATVDIKSSELLARQIQAELKLWPELVRSIGIKPGSA